MVTHTYTQTRTDDLTHKNTYSEKVLLLKAAVNMLSEQQVLRVISHIFHPKNYAQQETNKKLINESKKKKQSRGRGDTQAIGK